MPPPHHLGNPFGHQYEFRWPGNQTLQSSNPNYNLNVATQNFYMLPGQPPQLAHPGQNPCPTGQNLNRLQNFRDTFHTNQHVPVASYQQPDAGGGDSQQSSLHVTEEHRLGETDSTDRKISSHMSISKTSESGLIGSYIEKNHEIDQSSENVFAQPPQVGSFTGNDRDVEAAVQDAVLREQELATQSEARLGSEHPSEEQDFFLLQGVTLVLQKSIC